MNGNGNSNVTYYEFESFIGSIFVLLFESFHASKKWGIKIIIIKNLDAKKDANTFFGSSGSN